MKNEISKYSELKAVSFNEGLVKLDLQVNLIIDLLTNAIKEERMIGTEDIINCYLDFSFRESETIVRRYFYFDIGNGEYNKCRFTREELKEKKQYVKRMAFDWFRKNLGAAILKGKLLVIPIIDI